MTILVHLAAEPIEPWQRALAAADSSLTLLLPDAIADPAAVRGAIAWKPPPGALARYPNLLYIQSLGAGIDHLLKDPDLPDAAIARVVHPRLATLMVQHVCLQVLRFHRGDMAMRAAQAEAAWRWRAPPPDATIGILGLGRLGQAVAGVLRPMGFTVIGWTRARAVDDIETFAGPAGLGRMLPRCDQIVCLLPHTPDTIGVLDARVFAALPRGAFVVNAGRGAQLVEADLLAALDSGHLAGASLDVFATEPLPADHPLWRHPQVIITPHCAADIRAEDMAPTVAENMRRALAGEPVIGQVDRAQGY